ncbi:hypothetical protein HMI54_015277 [Coelomomyces lativittatus]|nr:hypothetical protein HMI54_015277 [Coelomomyces lativittatus]KAJ1514705.1 hypothetical protein HMI56_007616 [Coelomomyces lativittatus]KAJ1516643.1 hypothetical protein HMI55_001767 [Coelomomyces lativittatus]
MNFPSDSPFELSDNEEELQLNKDFSWFSQDFESTLNEIQNNTPPFTNDTHLTSSKQQTAKDLNYRFTISTYKSGIPIHSRETIDAKIAEWSKGSAFYENEKRKGAIHESKIQKLLQQVENIQQKDLDSKQLEVEKWIADLESERKLNAWIVLMDLDAFYASVAERDMPELKTKPMAVGDMTMLSTSNYVARKFGVRSGMPGYLAKKLCPELIIVPLHFEKYKQISQQVLSIQKLYDPNVQSWGLDESYLNLTEYMKRHPERNIDDVVTEIRMLIFEKVHITASAGIACNRLLSKICADINKPNGQFRLASEKVAILSFLENLPIRKVFGVGRVMEHTLNALNVFTCSDIFKKKALLSLVLSKKTFRFLLTACLGICNNEEIDTDGFPKSISSERTIQATQDLPTLMSVLATLSEDVASELQQKDWMAKQVTLKCKSIHFRVKQMGQLQSSFISNANELFNAASVFLSPLLHSLNAPLRLIGIRVSSLKSKSDLQTQFLPDFFRNVVYCPVCNKAFHENEINVHLDLCLFLTSTSESGFQETVMNDEKVIGEALNSTKKNFDSKPVVSLHSKKEEKKRKRESISPSIHQFLKLKSPRSEPKILDNGGNYKVKKKK